jgi:hypothetical protein
MEDEKGECIEEWKGCLAALVEIGELDKSEVKSMVINH